MAEQSGANYFSPLVVPEGLEGPEVQPRCRVEDCIWLKCAVEFYTIVKSGTGIAKEARCVNAEA